MQRAVLYTALAFAAVTFALYLSCLVSTGDEHGHGGMPANVLLFYVVGLGPTICLHYLVGWPMGDNEMSVVFVSGAAMVNALLGAILGGIFAAIWRCVSRRLFR
jgi:hypothetical protein